MTAIPSDAALQGLQSAEQVELMDAIDLLRSHGFDKKLDLPQLIVCGNQSSGKSSVLEAIFGFPFPTGYGTVTKFATEITLRKASQEHLQVSIEPGPNTPEAERKLLEESCSDLQAAATPSDLLPVLTLAAEKLAQMHGGTGFSSHRLRIQKSSPRVTTELTLVDLPGLIATTTQATKSREVEIVRSLIQGYMEQPRSIILAVTPAIADPETQEILELARNVDQHGSRTMGILTMPDRIQPGAEQAYVDLVSNRRFKFELGWHVLRNVYSGDVSSESRDQVEIEFFSAPGNPWAAVPESLRGIQSLRPKLGGILFQHISGSLPELIREIQSEVLSCEQRLKALGPSRRSQHEQLRYMERLCTELNVLIHQGIDATYEEDFFKEATGPSSGPRFLRTELRKLYDVFNHDVSQAGCQYHPTSHPDGVCPEHNRQIHTTAIVFDTNSRPQCLTYQVMLAATHAYAIKYRGRELPNEMPERATREIFKVLSAPWENIARDFANRCLETAEHFFRLAIHSAAPKAARSITNEVISDRFHDIKARLDEKVTEVLSPFRKLAPFTNSPAFKRALQDYHGWVEALSPGDATELQTMMSMTTVLALYSASQNTFIDNMIMLAVENSVVEPLKTMFTTQTVLELAETDPERFARIASESRSIELERDDLTGQLEVLQKVRRICNKFAFYRADFTADIPEDLHRPSVAASSVPSIFTPQQDSNSKLETPRGDLALLTPPITPEKSSHDPSSKSRDRVSSSQASSPARSNMFHFGNSNAAGRTPVQFSFPPESKEDEEL